MQYFTALREGQRRTAKALSYLNAITNDKGLPALALCNTKTSSWSPVGDETLYAFISDAPGFVLTDSSGYILALVDKQGTAKAIAQNIPKDQKAELVEKLEIDGVLEFTGEVTLPV